MMSQFEAVALCRALHDVDPEDLIEVEANLLNCLREPIFRWLRDMDTQGVLPNNLKDFYAELSEDMV